MDAVSHWFPPLTNREVLTILFGCAVAIVLGTAALLVPFQRRLRGWAAEQGFEVIKVEGISSYRQWWDTMWRVTVRDRSGFTRVATITFLGLALFPDRIEVQWQGADGPSTVHPQWTVGRLLRVWMFWLSAVGLVEVPALLVPAATPLFRLRFSLGLVGGVFIAPLLFSGVWVWRRKRSGMRRLTRA